MKNLLLVKIRLSTYFWLFFAIYFAATFVLPEYKFDAGSLTLFSVNSFLYGFYISPILAAQKGRIDALHQIVRSEANALFDLVLDLKKLPRETRNHLQAMVTQYINARLRKKKRGINGQEEYEALITFCVDYRGADKEEIEGVLSDLVSNQKNRTDFNMQLGNKVFSNEWHIIFILFSITLGFILTISTPNNIILHVVRALLATGLTMLLINLVKLSSLTHKKAKLMWEPLQKLVDTNFYRID
jgi:hypothetical protein